MSLYDATIVITTHNRRADLSRALRSAVAQRGATCEVLVIDDGSTDGTSEMVRTEFETVRVERCKDSRGLIVRRNEAARLAQGEVLISIDDDAEFSDPHIVSQTLAAFDNPRVGAVAIPFVDVQRSPAVKQCAPTTETPYVIDAFIGTAHAVRREMFLSLGGYRERLVHQGEERDYCLRMLESGFVVRLGQGASILHHESSRRSFARMDFYGRRNDVLFALQNVPTGRLFVHLAGTLLKGVYAASRSHHPFRGLGGLAFGVWQGLCQWTRGERQPVSRSTYRLHRRLKKSGGLPLSAIEPALPPLKPQS